MQHGPPSNDLVHGPLALSPSRVGEGTSLEDDTGYEDCYDYLTGRRFSSASSLSWPTLLGARLRGACAVKPGVPRGATTDVKCVAADTPRVAS
jgi:hypothetical protein